ncbi:MAG: sigma-70 family RNA polymerase sigma factor [bacterium]
MNKQIDKVLISVKKGEDNIYELWKLVLNYEDDYDKKHLKERLRSFAYSRNYEFEDVCQNAFIAFMDLFDNFDISRTQGDNLKKSFLGYIHNYLFKRLNNFKGYSIFNDSRMISYDQYDNYEFLNEDLKVIVINDNFIDLLLADNCYDKLSPREKQVYNLLREGYDDGYIANELDMSYQQVYNYKQYIRDKIM